MYVSLEGQIILFEASPRYAKAFVAHFTRSAMSGLDVETADTRGTVENSKYIKIARWWNVEIKAQFSILLNITACACILMDNLRAVLSNVAFGSPEYISLNCFL